MAVKFQFAEGLRASSPVRYCGVDVGEVKKVIIREILGESRVYVYVNIRKDIKISKDSQFFINSLSLFGEKYLEINPPEVTVGYINPGSVVDGISPVALFTVFSNFTKTMKEVEEFVKEGKIKTTIENSLSNIEDITLDLKSIVGDMRNKKGTIGRLLYDDSLYNVTEEFISDIKEHPWKLLHKPR